MLDKGDDGPCLTCGVELGTSDPAMWQCWRCKLAARLWEALAAACGSAARTGA